MMKVKNAIYISVSVIAILISTGCAVTRDQETMGAYVDDSVITSSIKTRFFEDKTVDGSAITVETLNGTVLLSGFVKSTNQKQNAESIAIKVKGVKVVKNQLEIRN
jgi:osmotically-inducible protein OsmY